MAKPGSVVLLSGGPDSTRVQAHARCRGFDCYMLSFRCGQRHIHEPTDATTVGAARGVARQLIAQLDLREFGGSGLMASSSRHVDRVAVHVRCPA